MDQGTPLSRVSVRAQRAAVPGFWRSLIPDFSGVPALRAWVPPSSTPCKSHVPLGATERDTVEHCVFVGDWVGGEGWVARIGHPTPRVVP